MKQQLSLSDYYRLFVSTSRNFHCYCIGESKPKRTFLIFSTFSCCKYPSLVCYFQFTRGWIRNDDHLIIFWPKNKLLKTKKQKLKMATQLLMILVTVVNVLICFLVYLYRRRWTISSAEKWMFIIEYAYNPYYVVWYTVYHIFYNPIIVYYEFI